MTNQRLDKAITSIESALDELRSALETAQQNQAQAAQNAQQDAPANPALSEEEMANLRGELAEAMDIVRQLQITDSAPEPAMIHQDETTN